MAAREGQLSHPGDVATPRPAVERRDVHEMRRRIAQARTRIDQTLDSIQERLSPRYVAQKTMDKIKQSGRQANDRVTQTVRRYPWPALAVAFGLAWMIGVMMRKRMAAQEEEQAAPLIPREREREPATERDAELRMHASLYEAGLERESPALRETVEYYGEPPSQEEQEGISPRAVEPYAQSGEGQQAGEQARQRISEAAGAVGEKASQVRQRAAETASAIGQRAQEVGQQVREQTAQLGKRVRERAKRTQHVTQETFEEHPISMAIAVFAAGLLAGLLLPTTQPESRLMGRQRNRLMRRASEYGQRMVEKSQAVAQRAVSAAGEAATEEAREQGLTPEQIEEQAKQQIQEQGQTPEQEEGKAPEQEGQEQPPRITGGEGI